LDEEYGADVSLERMPSFGARWVAGSEKEVAAFVQEYEHDCMHDKHGLLVCLFPNEYRLNLALKNYPDVVFSKTSER